MDLCSWITTRYDFSPEIINNEILWDVKLYNNMFIRTKYGDGNIFSMDIHKSDPQSGWACWTHRHCNWWTNLIKYLAYLFVNLNTNVWAFLDEQLYVLAVLWYIILANIRNLQVSKLGSLRFFYWIHGHTRTHAHTHTHTHTEWYYFHFLLSTELSGSSISVEIFFKRANHDKRVPVGQLLTIQSPFS